jgi:D-alanyl-D-alanine dipeptidase
MLPKGVLFSLTWKAGSVLPIPEAGKSNPFVNMWRTIFQKIVQFFQQILRFQQKNAIKSHFRKSYLLFKATAFLTLLTISCTGICFSQQISPVSSLKENTNVLRLQPEQKLVSLADYLSPLYKKIFYCTAENFTHQVLYDSNYSPYISLKAAKMLAKVQDSLQKIGLDMLIYDAYRPHSVTRMMWKLVPDERYAANPAKGSGHNRGIAIDLTLLDAKTGNQLEMPTGYDNFSDSAHHDFMQVSPKARQNRALLKDIMEYFGFEALPTEWWHYSLPNANSFPVYDISFKDLKQATL